MEAKLQSWKKAEQEIDFAVKNQDLKKAFRLVSQLAKFEKQSPQVKSLLLDNGFVISDLDKLES
jgi:hypothetical protein